MTYEDIVKQHVERFGVEPVVTGARHWDAEPLNIRVLNAIDAGEPYVEDDVPDGVDI